MSNETPEKAAGEIADAVASNLNVASQGSGGPEGVRDDSPGTAPIKPAADWRKEPKSNFLIDPAGDVILEGGEPKRRGGKPRTAKPGDLLADGTVMTGAEGQAAAGSFVGDPGGGDAPEGEGEADPKTVQLTEEAGGVLVEGVDSLAESVAGEKARLKAGEKAQLKRAAGVLVSGTSMGAWGVLLLFGALWFVRVLIEKRKNDGANASLRGRDDAVGKIAPGQIPRPKYPA